MAAGDLTATRGKASDLKGAVFDGVDDYINIPDSSDFDCITGTSDFTISAWARFIATGNSDPLVEQWVEDSERWLFYKNGTDTITFGYDDGSWSNVISSDTSLSASQWYHLVLTREGNNWKIYINGENDGSETDSHTIPNPNAPLRIGVDSNGPSFAEVTMAKIAIFNKELSSSEVSDLYAADGHADNESLGLSNHLVGYWKLEDDYSDSSSSGNDGTNEGTYILNNAINLLRADVSQQNLGATTDHLTIVPSSGRDQEFTVYGIEREA